MEKSTTMPIPGQKLPRKNSLKGYLFSPFKTGVKNSENCQMLNIMYYFTCLILNLCSNFIYATHLTICNTRKSFQYQMGIKIPELETVSLLSFAHCFLLHCLGFSAVVSLVTAYLAWL